MNKSIILFRALTYLLMHYSASTNLIYFQCTLPKILYFKLWLYRKVPITAVHNFSEISQLELCLLIAIKLFSPSAYAL